MLKLVIASKLNIASELCMVQGLVVAAVLVFVMTAESRHKTADEESIQ
jgi:hypothetical protein